MFGLFLLNKYLVLFPFQCFNGDVSIVDPSTPFSLEPLTDDDKCNDNYQAYLKIENMVPPEEDLFTFQVILLCRSEELIYSV